MSKDNTPTYDQSVIGYTITALRMAEIPPEKINEIVHELRHVLEDYTSAEMATVAVSSPY